MTEWEIIDETLRGEPSARAGTIRRGHLARLRAAVRDRAFPRRVRPSRQEIPLPRQLGGDAGPMSGRDLGSCPNSPITSRSIDDGDPAIGRSAWSRRRRARSSTPASTTRRPASRARGGRPRCIHPDDAGRARHRRRRRASASATARAASSSMPALSTGCRSASSSSRGSGRMPRFEEGIGINLLTSADPGPPQGGAVYHDTSVWLRPA